jgi:hypothetical protein
MTTTTTAARTPTLDLSGSIPLVNGIPVFPIFGATANYGITHSGDVLVSRLRDGTDLNEVWDEISEVIAEFNKTRLSIVSLLSYPTTNSAEAVSQNLTLPSFEEASEYGVPKSISPPMEVLLCGMDFRDWDLRWEATWKFLREADKRAVTGIVNTALAADNQLLTGKILRRILDPAEGRNEYGHRVFSLYNGTDGITPPAHLGLEFPTNTTHFISSGNAVLDSLDIEDSVRMIRDKGYGVGDNSHLIIFANPAQSAQIQQWRANVESRPGGPKSVWDFIPSKNSFPYLSDSQIVGETAPTDYNGLEILGSLGPCWLSESHFIPPNYVLVAATSGPGSPNNVCGMREHILPDYQNLRLIPGNQDS